MNIDLERDMAGEGEDLLGFVAGLQRAPQASVDDGFADRVVAAAGIGRGPRRRWSVPAALFAVAAAAAACLAFAAVFFPGVPETSVETLVACQRTDGTFSGSSASPYVQAFAVTLLAREPGAHRRELDAAVAALVRTQSGDGGWGGASLSARNTAALAAAAAAGSEGALIAYRRALRHLRANGIGELTPGEFSAAARSAARQMADADDAGLRCCAALCRGL